MRTQQLVYLQAVLQYGSFRRAAGRLGVSQPTLTDQIRRLEEELDVVLLHRGHAGVVPTAEAEFLLPYVSRLVEDARNLHEEASALGGLRVGTVRIGSTPTLSNALLCHAIRAFRLKYPNIRFEAIESGSHAVAEAVAQGQLDVGLLTSATPLFDDPRLHARQVLIDRLVACLPAGHRAAKESFVRVASLVDDPWIVYGTDYTLRSVFDDLTEGLQLTIAYQSTSAATMLRMVASDVGVAIATSLAVSVGDPSDRRRIAAVPIRGEDLPHVAAFIVRRRDHLPTPAGREFERVLRATAETMPHLAEFRPHAKARARKTR